MVLQDVHWLLPIPVYTAHHLASCSNIHPYQKLHKTQLEQHPQESCLEHVGQMPHAHGDHIILLIYVYHLHLSATDHCY